MQITLKDGRQIKLLGLHQYTTYGGVLAGLPGEKMNRGLMDDALAAARTRLFGERPAVVLEPPLTTSRMIESSKARSDGAVGIKVARRLPAVTTCGWFNCSDVVQDKLAFGSELVVV